MRSSKSSCTLLLLLTPLLVGAIYLYHACSKKILPEEESEHAKPMEKQSIGPVPPIFDTLLNHRQLQENTPTRACGEVIGTATSAEIVETLNLIAAGLYGSVSTDLELLFRSLLRVKYGIQARKICTSCQEAAELWEGSDFLLDASPNGFATYCGPDAFGHNTTISGLLLVPIDEEMGELVQGSLKTTVSNRVTSPRIQRVLSERWPTNMTEDLGLVGLEGAELAAASGNLYDLIVPMAAAAAGNAVLGPDYLGYGESYNFTKSWITKGPSQASAASLYLYSTWLLANETSDCTVLAPAALTAGYSAGGYNSIASASAMDQMGVEMLSVSAGSSPSRLSSAQMVTGAGNVDADLVTETSLFALPMIGYAYSSTNPDLVNTDVEGQNYLSDAYLDNVTEWVESGRPASVINSLLPENPLDIINENMTALVLEAYYSNLTDICVNQTANNDTYAIICEALGDNDLTSILESAEYPVTFCHSPDDFLVPIENLPNFTENPEYLSLFDSIPGFSVFGDHNTAGALCLIALLFPYTDPTTTSVGDAMSCAANVTTPAPTPTTNSTTPAPTNATTPAPSPASTPGSTPASTTSTPTTTPMTLMPTEDTSLADQINRVSYLLVVSTLLPMVFVGLM